MPATIDLLLSRLLHAGESIANFINTPKLLVIRTVIYFTSLSLLCTVSAQAIRLTHMSKAWLADDEPREGDHQDMTSRIYSIIRDYGQCPGHVRNKCHV